MRRASALAAVATSSSSSRTTAARSLARGRASRTPSEVCTASTEAGHSHVAPWSDSHALPLAATAFAWTETRDLTARTQTPNDYQCAVLTTAATDNLNHQWSYSPFSASMDTCLSSTSNNYSLSYSITYTPGDTTIGYETGKYFQNGRVRPIRMLSLENTQTTRHLRNPSQSQSLSLSLSLSFSLTVGWDGDNGEHSSTHSLTNTRTLSTRRSRKATLTSLRTRAPA